MVFFSLNAVCSKCSSLAATLNFKISAALMLLLIRMTIVDGTVNVWHFLSAKHMNLIFCTSWRTGDIQRWIKQHKYRFTTIATVKKYKKFKLLLTRCAKAYSSSCLQTVFVFVVALFCFIRHVLWAIINHHQRLYCTRAFTLKMQYGLHLHR